jgi:pimeloyl-ACP methyl ester carboxylesterase
MDIIDLPIGAMTFRARVAGPGDGELVLLLHGFPQTSAEWSHQIDALAAAGYRVVAPDQRGYSTGARPAGDEQYRYNALVADVLAFADWAGAHRFHLAGHDWGGLIAWMVAMHAPERLRSLTAVSVPHPAAFAAALATDADQQARSSYVPLFREAGAAERFLADDAAFMRAVLSGATSGALDDYVRVLTDPGAMDAALAYYRANDFSDPPDRSSVTVPTLFVWSTDDVALGRTAAEGTGAHVKGPYRFEVLEGVSHWIPDEAPEALSALMLEHLAANP